MSRKNKRRANNQGLVRYRNMPDVTVSEEIDGYKMSDVLRDFAEPFMDDASTYKEMHAVYSLAATAWNLAIVPPHERIRTLMPVLQDMPVEDRLLFKNALAELIEHKERAFADYRRLIVDFELVDQGDSYHLSVVSEIIVEEKGPGTAAEK